MIEGFKLFHEDEVGSAYYKPFMMLPDVEKQILNTMLENSDYFFKLTKTNITGSPGSITGFYTLIATTFKTEEGDA